MSSNRKLFNDAIETYGAEAQIEKSIEELAELILALQKHKQCKWQKKLWPAVVDEVADVEIMCHQLRILFPGVAERKKYKLERLMERIEVTRGTWGNTSIEGAQI